MREFLPIGTEIKLKDIIQDICQARGNIGKIYSIAFEINESIIKNDSKVVYLVRISGIPELLKIYPSFIVDHDKLVYLNNIKDFL